VRVRMACGRSTEIRGSAVAVAPEFPRAPSSSASKAVVTGSSDMTPMSGCGHASCCFARGSVPASAAHSPGRPIRRQPSGSRAMPRSEDRLAARRPSLATARSGGSPSTRTKARHRRGTWRHPARRNPGSRVEAVMPPMVPPTDAPHGEPMAGPAGRFARDPVAGWNRM
jgi:hypothetical protein